jgi:PAS domain S-box-containing protein
VELSRDGVRLNNGVRQPFFLGGEKSTNGKTVLKDMQSNTQRPRLARRSTKNSRGLENLPGPWIVVRCSDGVITEASSAMEQILLEAREQALGRPLLRFTGRPDASDWSARPIELAMLTTPGRYEDVLVRRADGSHLVVDMHVAPLFGTRGKSDCVCLFIDRTEQRRLGAELISKHQELRRAFAELEQRQEELESARAILENSNKELARMSTELSKASELAAIGEITAELTHQLNNPLAAAVGAARRLDTLLQRSPVDGTGPMMDLLQSSLERLKSTIADLRHVYRDSRPSDVELQAFDIEPQVRSALTLLQERLPGLRLEVSIPTDLPRVMGRPTNIQHVIVNLIDNAIHAAGKDGSLLIRASAGPGGLVLLGIGDSGPGVPPDLVEKIFEPFFTQRPDGSGLGLSFVRRHLDMDGASIRVGRSELGGALFEISLRVATLSVSCERHES